jgi:hypothetical protein
MSRVSQAVPSLRQLTPPAWLLLVAAAGAWAGVVLFRLQRRPDHGGLISPPRQARHRQQHIRPPAVPAPCPPRR